jgi:hypothetical protein
MPARKLCSGRVPAGTGYRPLTGTSTTLPLPAEATLRGSSPWVSQFYV